jgi:hypothetical protein
LKKRPPCSLETSGKKHPLVKYNIAEEWRSQLLCFKSIKTCINKVQCCCALDSYINLNLLVNYCFKSSFESSFKVFVMIILWVCELETMIPTHYNSWGNLKDMEQGVHSPLTKKLLSKNRLHDNIHQSVFTIVLQCSCTSNGHEYCPPIVSQKKVCHYSYLWVT